MADVNQDDRPYTINDLTVLHNLSYRTVVELYEKEPGVLILQASPERQRKIGRRHRTLRVPRHVYMRVRHKMEVR